MVNIINKPIVQCEGATVTFHWGQWMFPLKGNDKTVEIKNCVARHILRSERGFMSKLVCFVLKMGHSIAFPAPDVDVLRGDVFL